MHDADGRDLDLNLLRIFAVVVEEGSITRAASRLYVTQPAVSAAMRRLSTFLGAALFARQGRGIVLTARGEALAKAARAHLGPLLSATLAQPRFDPKTSTATVRLGLSDSMETLLLPRVLARLRDEAPSMQVIVRPVQFRTVEEALLSGRVDLAVTVADELPRSILRQTLSAPPTASEFVCLYDPRFTKLRKRLSEEDYFAREHVAVSYAGDLRGVVEDQIGRSRRVRVSVSALSHVADVVDGSPLLATIPSRFARSLVAIRPHLRTAALPFTIEGASLELLWLRIADDDPTGRFVRELVAHGWASAVALSGGRR